MSVLAATRGPRPKRALVLLATICVGLALAAGAVSSAQAPQSLIASEEALAVHGIILTDRPPGDEPPLVTAEQADSIAIKFLGLSKGADEIFRVRAGATYFATRQNAWLLLFVDLPFYGSYGPVIPPGEVLGEGVVRSTSAAFTGVIIDDQTGGVVRWFQRGSVDP